MKSLESIKSTQKLTDTEVEDIVGGMQFKTVKNGKTHVVPDAARKGILNASSVSNGISTSTCCTPPE